MDGPSKWLDTNDNTVREEIIMKMMDCVEVVVEKERYAKDGVHKGMQGWICLDDNSNGTWLVNFPQCGEKEDIAEISVKEEDLEVIPVMYAIVNEQIKAQFEEAEKNKKVFSDAPESLSEYLIWQRKEVDYHGNDG